MAWFLPYASTAYVDQAKVVEYLLAPTHPDGWSKARLFMRLGFRAEKWQELAEALREVGVDNPVVNAVGSAYGVRYAVDGLMNTPSGRRVKVRTIWILGKRVEHMTGPRLITAYPL